MSDQLRSAHYVNEPYSRVRDCLLKNSPHVLHQAAKAGPDPLATFHVHIGAVDCSAEVALRVVTVKQDDSRRHPATTVTLEWQADHSPRMFPSMTATLAISPLSATETQIELEGHYQVPLVGLGASIVDAPWRGVAEASVSRFTRAIVGWLREQLSIPATGELQRALSAVSLNPV